jgi:hypothetical protein
LGVAEVTDVNDFMGLDIGCYWEFSSGTASQAIQVGLEKFLEMHKFAVYWDPDTAPDSFLVIYRINTLIIIHLRKKRSKRHVCWIRLSFNDALADLQVAKN